MCYNIANGRGKAPTTTPREHIMTTKKAYEVKNSHEARNENSWNKLGKLIDRAWAMCEGVDHITEWDEQTLGTIISTVAEVDPKLAEIVEIEAIAAYGEDEVEDDWQDEDWGYDW